MSFDYRSLEPRVGIRPALKIAVGIIGAACLLISAGTLWVLGAEQGERDYSMLVGAAFLALIAYGCWLIVSDRLDRASDNANASSLAGRVLWTVLFAANLVLAVFQLVTGERTWGALLGTAFIAVFTGIVIYRTWRDGSPTGR